MTDEELNEKIYYFLGRSDVRKLLADDNLQEVYSKLCLVFEFGRKYHLDKDDWRQLHCRFTEFLYIDCKIEIFKFIRYLDSSMFSYSDYLPSYLYIPSNIEKVHGHAFEGCTSLESVYIEEGCDEIYNHAFKDCKNLYKIRFPASIEYFQDYGLFENCSNLKHIYVIKKSYVDDQLKAIHEYKKMLVYQKGA